MNRIGLNASAETMDALFDALDQDKSGYIEYRELKSLLKSPRCAGQ